MKKPEMITQSTVISMGWTKTMISKLLPPPVEKRNPYYGSAAPMKLWDKAKVEAAMQTEDYVNEYAKAQKRKKSAQKATATRAERLTEKMNKMGDTILVGIMDDEELVQTVLKEKEWQIKAKMENEWEYMYRRGLHGSDELYEYESLSDEIDYYEFHMPSKEVLDRWVVNYIRHNLIDYDYTIRRSLYGKTGKDEAYISFKKAVLRRIAETYPKYFDECQRQADDVECKHEMWRFKYT